MQLTVEMVTEFVNLLYSGSTDKPKAEEVFALFEISDDDKKTTSEGACYDKNTKKIYYNPNKDLSGLPNVATDYENYKKQSEQVKETLQEYAFKATLLHELGHWKQEKEYTDAVWSYGTTLTEYHNIIVNENSYPDRKRLFYSADDSKAKEQVKDVVQSIEELDAKKLATVFMTLFNGNLKFVDATDKKYCFCKELLAKLCDEGKYSPNERNLAIKNLLSDYCQRNAGDVASIKRVKNIIASVASIPTVGTVQTKIAPKTQVMLPPLIPIPNTETTTQPQPNFESPSFHTSKTMETDEGES